MVGRDSFLAALQERLGFVLDPAEPEELLRTFIRITLYSRAKAARFHNVGANVLRGRITPTNCAQRPISRSLADGHLRNTIMQNLLIVNVPISTRLEWLAS